MLKANHYFNGSIHFELKGGLKLVINHNILTGVYKHTSFVDLIVLQGDCHEVFRIGAELDVDKLTQQVDMLCNTLKSFIREYIPGQRVGLRDTVLKDLIRTLVVYPDVFKTSSILYRQLQNTIFTLIGEESYHYVTVFDAVYDDESGDHVINKYIKYRAGYDLFELCETKDENGEIEYWNGDEDNEDDDYDDDDIIEEEVVEEVVEETVEEAKDKRKQFEKMVIEKERNKFAPIKDDELGALLCDIDSSSVWKLDRANSRENHDFTVFPFGKYFFEKDEENNTAKIFHDAPKSKEDVMKKFCYNLDLIHECNRFEDVWDVPKDEYICEIKEMEKYIEEHTLEEICSPEGRYFFVTMLRNILMTDYDIYQDKETGTWQYDDDEEDLEDEE
nr:MAG TPA: hypothetical protein [Caudoviricetes sp.]